VSVSVLLALHRSYWIAKCAAFETDDAMSVHFYQWKCIFKSFIQTFWMV